MGKTKKKNVLEVEKTDVTVSKNQEPEVTENEPKKKKVREHGVSMPDFKKNLTAANLTTDQKMIVKKQCQIMYKHNFREKRVTKIETAQSQLEKLMEEKVKQLKLQRDKKKKLLVKN